MKKRKYRSEEGKFFIGFLPTEIFENLSPKEKEFYKKYRDNHRWKFEGELQVEKLKNEIEKLKGRIFEKEKQIKDWNGKMLEGYSQIGYLSNDFDFWCSVNLRKIKPQRLKLIEKGKEHTIRSSYMSDVVYGDGSKEGRKVNNPSNNYIKFIENIDTTGDKTPFEPKKDFEIKEKYYIRIEPKLSEKFENTKWLRNLFVGERESVVNLLSKSFSSVDWNSKSEKVIRDNLREIYKGYVRYQIFKFGINHIKHGDKGNPLSQHPVKKVEEWVDMMGDGINEWMDK